MDLNRHRSGTASAAMNMARCWMGAGGIAFAGPLTNAAGIDWLTVTITGIWLLFSPFAILLLMKGQKWRELKPVESEKFG